MNQFHQIITAIGQRLEASPLFRTPSALNATESVACDDQLPDSKMGMSQREFIQKEYTERITKRAEDLKTAQKELISVVVVLPSLVKADESTFQRFRDSECPNQTSAVQVVVVRAPMNFSPAVTVI
jgi:hypothetical protein